MQSNPPTSTVRGYETGSLGVIADIVIKGGTVVDGTGAPPRTADVAVHNGVIVEVAPELSGTKVFDAEGCMVGPGFIDIHTHYDAQVFWDPALSPSCYHGVTTVVTGNCGFSIAPMRPEHREIAVETLENVEDMNPATLAKGIPWDFTTFPSYLSAVQRRGTLLNFGTLIGHTAIRLFVMGTEAMERAATPPEVADMCEILSEAMAAGAMGFSSSFSPSHMGAGGRPVPSRLADRDEVEALLGVMKRSGRGIVSLVPGGPCSVEDLYALQPQIGVPFTYAALVSMPGGEHIEAVERHRQGWASGGRVWPQVTPRPLIFSFSMAKPFPFGPNPAFAVLSGASLAERRTAYDDPSWRSRAVAQGAEQTVIRPRWDTFSIAESAANPGLIGSRVSELAAAFGLDPLESLIKLALEEEDLGLRVQCTVCNDDPEQVGPLLLEPNCTLGISDAGAHVDQLCDAPQATDFLGNWVRDRGLMPIEDAIERLTGRQAALLGLTDRGVLKVGKAADITVFDFEEISPGPLRRLRDFPGGTERLSAPEPTGIRMVLVNGTVVAGDVVVEEGVQVLPGQIVRPSSRSM